MKNKLYICLFILFALPSVIFASIPNEINYQGRLREDNVGVTGNRTFRFNIYDAESGGNILWTSNDQVIFVSSGTFNYVLTPTVDWKKEDLWIETLVGGSILLPRQKITSTIYSLHSKTTEELSKSSGETIKATIGNVTYLEINETEVKSLHSGTTYYMVPKGTIVMWSGILSSIPSGWQLCNGTNGTPDLRDKFIYGVNADDPGGTGGTSSHSHTVNNHNHTIDHTHGMDHNHTMSHTHTIGHSHTVDPPNTGTSGGSGSYWQYAGGGFNILKDSHNHYVDIGAFGSGGSSSGSSGGSSSATTGSSSTGSTGGSSGPTSGQAAPGTTSDNNLPPYYRLAFIMKL